LAHNSNVFGQKLSQQRLFESLHFPWAPARRTTILSNVLTAAHQYIDTLNWAVFPCHGKHPTTSRGYLDATTDHLALNKLWKRKCSQHDADPDTVAIACKQNGFFAVDIDPRDGGDEHFRELVAWYAGGELPTTVEQLSGGGGQHILYRAPIGFNPQGELCKGVQIKYNGYIVAAPSLHEDTRQPYRWNPQRHPINTKISDAPFWLLELIEKKDNEFCGLTDWAGVELFDVKEGSRNTTLARLAGHLFSKGVDPVVAHAVMLGWYCQFCEEPLDQKEAETTIKSIYRREARK
jgi:Bifunctional DNA primase/polymerase, N-terminal/Primase C terminal 1 (PriCT-1)